jgi:ketosteroid isomerase-like protein
MEPTQIPITGREDDLPTTPRGALAEFYRAFNGRDLTLMAANWLRSDEDVLDNPLGGIRRGWPAIEEVYRRVFASKAAVEVEFFDYTLHEAGEVFWAVGRERGRLSDGSLQLAIRTTRLFRRHQGRWRQTHHHGSFDDPAMLKAYQERVR